MELLYPRFTACNPSLVTALAWSTINNYKNGSEISFKNACKIADALNISLDQLRKEVNKNEKQFK
ncbi:helix-turn-helix transcriptional regulator [Lactobacillus sp. B4005]|nr:helix-turn-helix transcriptional regulator [Lactobacillus sp.]MCX8723091.1 helix-turn-helix transcriptional regulator [Lactobacillus sp. B4005]